MREAARQLAFDLPPRTRFGRADFLLGRSNEAALRLLDSWPRWPGRLIHLAGPPGSGKSHLAAIWAERAGATLLDAADVDLDGGPALVAAGPIAIENVDRDGIDARALFHLVNRARGAETDILFTSRGRLDPGVVPLPDLLSRLRLAPRVLLETPDDDLIGAVLAKLFADRQIIVDRSVVIYLEHRIERSFEAARRIVAALDIEALRRNGRVTRALAAALLGDRDGEEDPDDVDADDRQADEVEPPPSSCRQG